MTDHPRFERVEGPVETQHDRYHGGALVAFVLRLADLWALRRPLRWASLPWRAPDAGREALGVRRARRRVLLTGVIMLAVVLAVTLWLPAKRDGTPAVAAAATRQARALPRLSPVPGFQFESGVSPAPPLRLQGLFF